MPSPMTTFIAFADPALYSYPTQAPKVIALEECAPPALPSHPPSTVASDVDMYSTSSGSSSCSSMSEEYEDDEESEDEACTSYCSSDDASPDESPLPRIDDTFRARLRRIESWRDMMLASTLPEDHPTRPSTPVLQKRKAEAEEDAFYAQCPPRKHARSSHSLGALACPACDADFATPSCLRNHGRASSSENDACRVAVDFHFEQ
ncbi:unnamed protein product [Peniophora sp. CBMAI 1063]|nr:unnamed protein product [Peniophora sp. CBMAI 1063]